jgi:hypothetical protein
LDCCRLVLVARGDAWSPATHRHWPDAFKGAARTLLLAAGRTGGGPASGIGGCGVSLDARPAPPGGDGDNLKLAALPADVLLRILQLAAMPMSAWL